MRDPALADEELPGETESARAISRFGDFDLLEEIGRGGMGIVYRARQRSVGRVVALKLLQPGRMISPIEIERFSREAETIARLARIFHTRIEQRSGGGVTRLDITEPNETATHRFFFDRL